jgi:hypothetical protein
MNFIGTIQKKILFLRTDNFEICMDLGDGIKTLIVTGATTKNLEDLRKNFGIKFTYKKIKS